MRVVEVVIVVTILFSCNRVMQFWSRCNEHVLKLLPYG